ncbi:MAG: esterase [Gallionella sp.]
MSSNYVAIIIASLPAFFGLVGCAPFQQYRTIASDNCVCNVKNADEKCAQQMLQHVTTEGHNAYHLGFIEFDDQGQLWDRDNQKNVVIGKIKQLAASQDLLMVVFVHGWKHSAAPNDPNINTFREVLEDLTDAENKMSEHPRTVFGLYLGWRGESITPFLWLDNLTFWDRKNTAHKVGHGGVTEVLSELESIRDSQPDRDGDGNRTKLAVIGHSFGGAVVSSALTQLLENRLVAAKQSEREEKLIKGFGDIVVLINPAFEATRYTPLADMSTEVQQYDAAQLPILAILTSEADWATKYAFKIGRYFSTAFETNRYMGRKNATTLQMESINEGQANVTAVGHFADYQTHTLKPLSGHEKRDLSEPKIDAAMRVNNLLTVSDYWADDHPGSEIPFGKVMLNRGLNSAAHNPYLLAYVDKNLISDHNDIDDPRVMEFIKQLIMLSSHSKQDVTKAKVLLQNRTK